jgi:putative DNA primase/helicase
MMQDNNSFSESIINTEELGKILDFQAVPRTSLEEQAKIKAVASKKKVVRNAAIHNEVEESISEALRNYPQLIEVVSSIKKVPMTLAAGKNPGESVSKDIECTFAILELVKTARILKLPISKMENTGNTVYQYSGKYWKKISKEIVKVLVSKAAFKVGLKFAQANNPSFIDDLYEQLLVLAFAPEAIVNASEVKINLLNGTLSIKDGIVKTIPHNQADNFKYCLPYDFDPNEECRQWIGFLNRIQPNKEVQMILQEFAGYCFIPNSVLNLEAMLILSGDGANGKSTFEKVLIALYGKENCSEKSLSDLSANSNSRLELVDKIANISSETKDHFDVDLFKKLASGESIEVKKLYADSFTLTNGPRHIVSMNKRPRDIENTHGFFRRWREIPFKETISNEEKITNFENQLIKELPGILNWVLEGLKRLMANREFTRSEIVEKAIQDFREDSDSVLSFIKENNYQPSTQNHIAFSVLYDSYVKFVGKGSYPVSARKFSKRIETMNYKKHTQLNVRGFLIETIPSQIQQPSKQDLPF